MKFNIETKKWLNTNELFNDWVANNKIKTFFSKNICYDGLSLWWISKIISKDNVIDNEWYFKLKNCLNNQKFNCQKYNWIFFFLKLIKNFLKNLIDLFFYKIISLIYHSKFDLKNKKLINCFHSFSYNFQKSKNSEYVDRLYGKSPYFKKKSSNITPINPK